MTSFRLILKRVLLHIAAFILILPVFVPAPVLAEGAVADRKINIAVNNLTTKSIDQNTAEILTDAFRSRLSKYGQFNVMERSNMKAVFEELRFQQTAACDASSCAVEVGQILGVERIIVGSIGKVGQTWSINLRMVSVETGKIIKDEAIFHKGTQDELLTKVMGQLADKIAGNPQSGIESKWIWAATGGAVFTAGVVVGVLWLTAGDEDPKEVNVTRSVTIK